MEAKLKKILSNGPKTNKELRSALSDEGTKVDPRLDRTLQKLRKDGKVQVINGRWALSTIDTCPTCKGKGWVTAKGAKTKE